MQIAARTVVYSGDHRRLAIIACLAETDEGNDNLARIIDFRVLEDNLVRNLPNLRGAIINLNGKSVPITRDGCILAYFSGEAAYYQEDAAKHYIELCKRTVAQPNR